MKRHLTLATRREYALRHVQAGSASVTGESEENGRLRLSPEVPRSTPVDTSQWKHTLVLTGRLDCYSADELEDEIENLREEGVGALTLDLRRLEAIDSHGIQVVASQGALFKEGGREFTVVPGLRPGLADDPRLADLLSGHTGERIVPRFSKVRGTGGLRERCTTMIHYLTPYPQAEGG